MFNFDDFELTPAHIIKTIMGLAIIGVLSFLVARYAKRRVVTGQYTALPAAAAAPAVKVEPMKEEEEAEEVDAIPTTVEAAAAAQVEAPVSAPSFGAIRIA